MTFDEQLELLSQSDLMDSDWYLQEYPDVAAAGMVPAAHYLKYGALMGRDPGPGFSTFFYQTQNPDVGSDLWNPLIHFLTYGHQEGRLPSSA